MDCQYKYQLPSWLQFCMPGSLFRLRPTEKVVYLTFDDGPIPEVTPRVLDILRHYGVKATFFMVGHNVEKHPAVFQQVVAEGHSVGNHTYHHVKGLRTRTCVYLEEVSRTASLMPRTHLFRPPYGRTWFWQRCMLRRQGWTICLWDVMTHDYDKDYSPERMLAIVQRYTRPGSIINFHDSLKSNERMLAVLPRVIEWLQQEGYQILPLDEQM